MDQDRAHPAVWFRPLHQNVSGRRLLERLGRRVFDALEATSRRVFTSTGFSDWFGLERPITPRNIRVGE